MTSAPIVYVMKGVINSPPYQEVTWRVYGSPDLTGANSGYSGLINIVIDYTISPDNEQAIPTTATPNGVAGGDLSGNYPNPTVVGLQTHAISNQAPANGQVLTWDNSAQQWIPKPVSMAAGVNAGGDLTGTYPNPLVKSLTGVGGTINVNGTILNFQSVIQIFGNNDPEGGLTIDSTNNELNYGNKITTIYWDTNVIANPSLKFFPWNTVTGAGASGKNFTISSQDGQNTTGIGQNGGNAGNLILNAGLGGTSTGGGGSNGTDGTITLKTGTTTRLTITPTAITISGATINLPDITTATSATAGANGDVPAQVVGYIVVNIGGTNRKIPYYAT